MLIALLLAGQHTSSTTSAWLGFFIAKDKKWQVSYRNNGILVTLDLVARFFQRLNITESYFSVLLTFTTYVYNIGAVN